MSNKLIRKKPGYTKNGEVKLVSLNVKQLLEHRQRVSKKKTIAKINRRLTTLGYVVPVTVVEEIPAGLAQG
jgi:hypothetical protein